MKKLLLSILSFTAVFHIANAQWVKQDTAFTGGPIPASQLNANKIFAVDANVVWAISERSTAAGARLFSKQFSKTVDGGITWTHGAIAALTDTTFKIACFEATSASNAYALFYGSNPTSLGGLFRTTDGGLTWTLCNIAWAGVATSFPNVVHFFDANNGVVQGDPSGNKLEIFTTSDAGVTWTAVPALNKPTTTANEYGLVDSYDAFGDTIYFGTTAGRIHKSVDKGLNWTATQSHGATVWISTIVCKSGSEIIASGAPTNINTGVATGSVVYRKSINGGTNWTTAVPSGTFFTNGYTYVPSTASLSGFWMSYGATALFANFGHSVSSDFTAFTQADSVFHYQMDVVDENTAYAVGRYGNTSGLNAFEKITSFAPYRTFLGLNNISKSNAKVGIMPNPSTGIFSVISENLKSTVKVTLTDVMGKVISNETITNTGDFKLDYSAKNKGVYFLTITDNFSTLTQRVVIQ
jgi:Secretion system C-terminal sorting domain